MRLEFVGHVDDLLIEPFTQVSPSGRPMRVRVESRHGECWLEGSFEPFDDPEEALSEFSCVADRVADLLTVHLGSPVTCHYFPVVDLGDGKTMGPWDLDVFLSAIPPQVEDSAAARSLLESVPGSPLFSEFAHRYRRALSDQSRLLGDAYYCLSRLEKSVPGGRRAAARLYGVDMRVLDALGEITGTAGDSSTARKHPQRPLLQQEADWVLEVLRSVAVRLSMGATQPPLAMTDLPPLPERAR